MSKQGITHFLKHFMTIGVGTVIYVIIGMIGTPILTRLVDPAEYGRASLLSVYGNIGMTLCGLGLDQALLRYFYKEKSIHYQRGLVLICCGFPLAATAITGCVLLASYAAGLKWFDFQDILLLILNVAALLLNRISLLLLRLRSRSQTYSLVNIVYKASYIGVGVVLILLFGAHHYEILAGAMIFSTLLASVIAFACERDTWKLPKKGYSFPVPLSDLFRYGAPFILSCGVIAVFSALDKLFIQHYCTMDDVGVYASAMNLVAVFSVVRTAFNAIWMPSAVEHYENHPSDRTFYQQGNAFISVALLLMGAIVVLCKDVIVLLLGEKYQQASQILPYLMFEPIMYTISETTATGFVVKNKSNYQVIVAVGACAVNFVGNWLLTPRMGSQGAALSTGIAYIVFFALRTAMANKAYYIDYKLKRFAIATAALFAFAIYGSNHAFSAKQILIFFGVAAVVVGVYGAEVSVGTRWVLKQIRQKGRTKRESV